MALFGSAQAAKPHLHLAGDRCPTCDQPIPNDRREEVQSRIDARARELQAEAEARVKAEVQQARSEDAAVLEAEKAKFAAREDAVRQEGEARAAAGFATKLKETADAKLAADKKIAELQANQELAVAARVLEVREALEKDKVRALGAADAKHFEENQKWKKLFEDAQRKLESKTAEELGEGAEVDLFEALKAKFPTDLITRVGRGNAGADVMHEVRHNGAVCGLIVYDSKNHGAWRGEHAAKLREDQLAAKADHAILSTRKFPSGAQQLHIENGVILVNPARAVMIAKILRRHTVQLHTSKASNQERSRKSDEIYAFMTSERFEQFIGTLMGATKDLDDLQVEERKAHEKTWRRQGEMVAKLKKATSTFDEAVERIIAASTVMCAPDFGNSDIGSSDIGSPDIGSPNIRSQDEQ